jgi:penicillin-binding protein 1C
VLSPEACFLILDILGDNPPPTRPELSGQVSRDIAVAWKTGTSYAFRDAWAIGISGDYVVAVWVGNFSGEGNPAFIGRSAAGPLLFEILRDLNRGDRGTAANHLKPGLLNLARVRVCATSGDLPGHDCPQTVETWYIPGVSPIKVCRIHRAVPIDPASGLRACWQLPDQTGRQVFEFWPSDLQQIFRSAGIALRTPPPFHPDCSLDERSSTGQPPQILSPMSEVGYRLRQGPGPTDTIPFQAACDADVRQLYWFVNNRYVGTSRPGQPLFWPAQSGRFAVRGVDDHGRAAQVVIQVGRVADSY